MIPSNDSERVAALESYGILDTPGETTFDLVTSMVSQMLQVPHSCVSLVDTDRVWFKSAVGVEASEVTREAGFCSTLVVSDEDVRHIEDASQHPEAKKNSLVCGQPGIRFYAGAPLCTPEGHRIGTLCAFGPEPRGFSETERASLLNLATLVMHEIELRSTRRQLERTEAALRQSQRLESIGLVASGVAHDFNNLLSGILGNAELLRRRLVGNSDGQELVAEIETTGRRAADLVGQVLAYAGREDDAPPTPVDVNALVCETHRMVGPSLPSGVVIRLDPEAGLPTVLGQATGLRQLVMNLLTNASEACGEAGGEVRLTTAWDAAAGTVVLTVADDGRGMVDEVKTRIYEPFFSSKASGRGLGLAICRRIVEQHDGTIAVDSEVGRGTTFRVTFPACSQRAAQEGAVTQDSPRRVGEGLVLVVDDESTIREIVRRTLEDEGYEVLLASGGAEGIELLDANRSAISVVVLDWSMPIVDGQQVLEAMQQWQLAVPVVLASGHREEDAREKVASYSVDSFLKKPFTLKDLVLKVEQAREDSRG